MSAALSELKPLILELWLGVGIVLLLLGDLVLPAARKRLLGYAAAALPLALLVASFFVDVEGSAFGGAYQGGAWVLFFKRVFLVSATLGVVGAVDHLARTTPHRQGEYYLLLLFSLVGMMILPGARDLILLVIAFELMGIPLYLMAAYGKSEAEERTAGTSDAPGLSLAAEAGLKLYLIGAASTTILLFGAGLLAGVAGTTSLAGIAGATSSPLLMLGAMLMLGGMAFKIGAAPFHMWVPDTYQGAQAPFVAFLSVAPKAAGIAAIAAVFFGALGGHASRWLPAVAAMSVASMLIGNFLALHQTSARRLLAFSGVAQIGYVLLGLSAGTANATAMVLFYLAAYVATNLGAFLIVHAVSANEGGDDLAGFEGLSTRAPWLSAALLLLLLSLAGIPFVVGFWAKLYIFAAALKADLTWLVVFGAVLAVVGLFYYLRIVKAMYMAKPRRTEPIRVSPGVAMGIAASVAVAVGAGLWPGPLVAAAERAANVFFTAG